MKASGKRLSKETFKCCSFFCFFYHINFFISEDKVDQIQKYLQLLNGERIGTNFQTRFKGRPAPKINE